MYGLICGSSLRLRGVASLLSLFARGNISIMMSVTAFADLSSIYAD